MMRENLYSMCSSFKIFNVCVCYSSLVYPPVLYVYKPIYVQLSLNNSSWDKKAKDFVFVSSHFLFPHYNS